MKNSRRNKTQKPRKKLEKIKPAAKKQGGGGNQEKRRMLH